MPKLKACPSSLKLEVIPCHVFLVWTTKKKIQMRPKPSCSIRKARRRASTILSAPLQQTQAPQASSKSSRKCCFSQVDPANIRPVQEGPVIALLEAERVAEATKHAIKRKIAQAAYVDFQLWTLPAKLRLEPEDPEDVKAAKRKKIHAFMSKMRLEQLEVTQNKRQNAWQRF